MANERKQTMFYLTKLERDLLRSVADFHEVSMGSLLRLWIYKSAQEILQDSYDQGTLVEMPMIDQANLIVVETVMCEIGIVPVEVTA